ncbi:MAG TPA: hypothetical protein PKY22_08600 [Accumulibacter sp.]|nr:hypothetical protein [Accumulibacter sp.]
MLILPLVHAGDDASRHTPADLRHLPGKQMLSSDDPDLKNRLKMAFDAACAATPPVISTNS